MFEETVVESSKGLQWRQRRRDVDADAASEMGEAVNKKAAATLSAQTSYPALCRWGTPVEL